MDNKNFYRVDNEYDYSNDYTKKDLAVTYFWGMSGVIAGVAFVLFLILKLFNIINWSWWWVTAPLWGYYGLIMLIIISILIFCAIDGKFCSWVERKKKKKELKNSIIENVKEEAKVDEQIKTQNMEYQEEEKEISSTLLE